MAIETSGNLDIPDSVDKSTIRMPNGSTLGQKSEGLPTVDKPAANLSPKTNQKREPVGDFRTAEARLKENEEEVHRLLVDLATTSGKLSEDATTQVGQPSDGPEKAQDHGSLDIPITDDTPDTRVNDVGEARALADDGILVEKVKSRVEHSQEADDLLGQEEKGTALDISATYEPIPARAEEMAYASKYDFDRVASMRRQMEEIKGQFTPDEMPLGLLQVIAGIENNIDHSKQRAGEVAEAAGNMYDQHQQKREAFHVEPRSFAEDTFEKKLPGWRIKYERKMADQAVREFIDTSITDGQSLKDVSTIVSKAITLKRSSQLYIMDNAEHPMDGWDTPQGMIDNDVIRAIVPHLPREVARALYRQGTEFTTAIHAGAADLIDREKLWPSEPVLRILDVMGVENAQDLEHNGTSESGATQNQYVEQLATLLHRENDFSQRDFDVRLEYYRRRMETSHGEDPDLRIGADMVTALGIKPEIALDIVRSASDNQGGEGLSVIGLEPILAISSITDKVDHLGVAVINQLHDELGTTSFHWYDNEHLQFLKKVIDRDPETLKILQGDETIVGFIDATDDYSGGMLGVVEPLHPKQTNGKSLVFEVGSMGGEYTVDSLMQKYADFLSVRGISIQTIIFGGHGGPDSSGITVGGLRLGFGKHMEKIDTNGMRAVLELVHDNGTVVVESCSQGAINEEQGVSTTGEFVRVANDGRKRNIKGFGYVEPSGGMVSSYYGGVVDNSGKVVVAYIDDKGSIHQEPLGDRVIRIPAFIGKQG